MKLFILIAASVFSFSNSSNAQGKFKPSKDMVSIIPFMSEMTVKVGQKLYYGGHVHTSVGNQVSVASEDNSVLALEEKIFEYDDLKKSEMSGGDAATRYYIYNATSVGVSDVLIQEYFRGELKHSYTVRINVIE
ncbi:MAG: hypothetical protein ACI837_000003 [Crocinitomicaceae bacterium]|jgi:hypothetical protein